MHVSYKGDYALKAILDLALHYGKGLVTIGELSQRIQAPAKFLEQVLLELKKGGFVESRRGNIGGYRLSKEPEKIKLGDVVRFIDGPVEPIACVEEDYKGCLDTHSCIFRQIWLEVGRQTSQIIDNITFEELAGRARQAKHALAYSI